MMMMMTYIVDVSVVMILNDVFYNVVLVSLLVL